MKNLLVQILILITFNISYSQIIKNDRILLNYDSTEVDGIKKFDKNSFILVNYGDNSSVFHIDNIGICLNYWYISGYLNVDSDYSEVTLLSYNIKRIKIITINKSDELFIIDNNNKITRYYKTKE